ncbi:SpoIID/LytB domain-containing protein [Georgenia sp. AZ-5]|uniref:SpoIID/LytB domain-containing protein n=1 Tax=Georgenia sp. AZ-5 TaxID=3367526 RepID=UPI003755164B
MRALRSILAAGAAVALTVTALVAAPSSAVAAEERYAVPVDGAWEVEGRGWGHGKGLSQWGAQGAALQGLSADAILGFYYPGTTSGSVNNRTLGVQLTSLASTNTVTLWAPAGQTAISVGVVGGAERTLAPGRLTITRDGTTYTLERRATVSGAVEDRLSFEGAQLRVRTDAGVAAAKSTTSSGGTWYRGEIRLAPGSAADTFDVVNDVPLESYLRGVVPREAPASWHPEALKAQAVAARSYVLSEGRTTKYFNTCDSTQCQVYGGRATVDAAGKVTSTKEDPRTDTAIEQTAGIVRMYGGQVAFTQFSSTNGGYSRAGTQPYMVARPDPYTGTAPGDNRTVWTDTLKASDVARHCPSGGNLRALVIAARDGNGALGGRITKIRLECTTGTVELTGNTTLAFGMYSHWWVPRAPVDAGPVVRGGMLAWYSQGDRASRLGDPVANERRVLDGVVQEFERGTVYMSPRSTWATLGSMDGLYGGPSSVLGWPAGDERSVRDGFVQRFEKGSLLVRPSGDWRTVGSIDVAFWRNGGPGGVLGFPTGEQSCSGGQCVQHFAGGRVYSAGSGGAVLRGGMLSWYLQGDRASRLGWPVADERRVLDGVVQEFERGTVYMSPRSTWATLGSMDGLYGGPSSVLGWPAGDERSVRDGFVQRFEKGSLLVRPSGDWRTVGSIDVAFWRNGGPGGVLGFPTGEQSCSGGQCVQHFAGGRVYSAGSGGAVLRGGMLSWYLQGDRASRLGRPVADERRVLDGVVQEFERGTVYMSPRSTWATLGSMDGLYGGPSSVLGWPAGDERSVRDGFVQRFEKGSLLVRPSGDWRTVGSIDVAFWRNGGPGGVLGFPTGEQSCSGGQCVQHFAGGRVYSAGSGGAVLRGGMLSWYLQGDRASRLGRPVADERTVAGGVIQQFERGTVHMTPASVRIR